MLGSEPSGSWKKGRRIRTHHRVKAPQKEERNLRATNHVHIMRQVCLWKRHYEIFKIVRFLSGAPCPWLVRRQPLPEQFKSVACYALRFVPFSSTAQPGKANKHPKTKNQQRWWPLMNQWFALSKWHIKPNTWHTKWCYYQMMPVWIHPKNIVYCSNSLH